MRESDRRIPRRSLIYILALSAVLVVLLEVFRPGSFLRTLWPGDSRLKRTPAQSVREGLEGRRPRRPSPPEQD